MGCDRPGGSGRRDSGWSIRGGKRLVGQSAATPGYRAHPGSGQRRPNGALAPSFEPALERALAFLSGTSGNQPLHAEVFVQVGPMNAFTGADQFPVVAFGPGRVDQPRIPSQRDRDGATVRKLSLKGVLRNDDVFDVRRGEGGYG